MMKKINSMPDGERQELADWLLAWEALISPSSVPPSKKQIGSSDKKNRRSLSARRSSMLERFNSSRKQVDSPKSSRPSSRERQLVDLNYGSMSAPVPKKKSVRDVVGLSRTSRRFKTDEVDNASNNSKSIRSIRLLAPDLTIDDDNVNDSRRPRRRRESSVSPVSTTSNRGLGHRRWSTNEYAIRNASPRRRTVNTVTNSASARIIGRGNQSLSTIDHVSLGGDRHADGNASPGTYSVAANAKVKIASAKARQKSKVDRRKYIDESLNRLAPRELTDVDRESYRYSNISSSVHESPGAVGKKGWYNSFHQSQKGSITGPTRKKMSLRDVFSPSRRRQSIGRTRGGRSNAQDIMKESPSGNGVEMPALAIPNLDGDHDDNEIHRGSSSSRNTDKFVNDRVTTPTRRKPTKRRSDLPPKLPF